jgi:dTDP-4-dehydrorhamnose 3,5-epimerase
METLLRFVPTTLAGAFVIEQERCTDARGFFARTWCQHEFAEYGLEPTVVQCSVAFNHRRGTLRGLHYQAPPFTEAKLVRCTRGAFYDVAVDLRPDSPTFRRWVGVVLTEDDGRAHYIPRGLAHGLYVLSDATEAAYLMSMPHAPEAARGIRWNDPFHSVTWPGAVEVISPRDLAYPDVDPSALEGLRGLCGKP